ncbi:MAG: efflux RND transporter periplasmic adaptor subunit [Sedimentisphaerales bacterium]|nr:efflux RND transporter periplasmic adaptor subunit [Sedimentisphaerales bacterium]
MTVTKNDTRPQAGAGRSFRIIVGLIVIAAIGLAVVWLGIVRGGQSPLADIPTFVAKRGPLLISVLESGTIKAREQEVIYNEVEGRTSIVSIVPEGTRVKKGDLLIKLDDSTLKDTRIDQEIRVQNAYASHINAVENFEVVKNQAISDVNVAELTLEFARQDLQRYTEGQYPNDKAAAENEIRLAEEELTRAEEKLTWSQTLYDEKYLSKTELQADQLARNSAEVRLQVRRNDLALLENYTYKREIAQLQSDVTQAEMSLERTQRKARANVVQAEADLKARKQEYDRQLDKLTKIEDQIKKATIYAPRDGMVIYATSAQRGMMAMMDSRQPLQEGVEVFERQELIYLPTAASSKAEVTIHEASLQKVRVGLPAVVTVDALPGKKFLGRLASIAPLPDPQSMFLNPDLKVYNSDVYLDTDDPSLRTGMGCKVEIVVEQHQDAVYVPVQSVVRIDGQPTVYLVAPDGSTQPHPVEIGLDNDTMVHVASGLDEGQTILLTPPLASAVAQMGSNLSLGTGDPNSAGGAMSQAISERLQEADNLGMPGAPTQGLGEPGMGAGGMPGGGGFPEITAEQKEQMQHFMDSMSAEQRKKIEAEIQRFMNMSAEERQQMQQQFMNMTPEERQRMQQEFMGGGGLGQGQGAASDGPGGNP